MLTVMRMFSLINLTDPYQSLMHDYMEWRMVQNPEYGTDLGRHEFDHLITDYTEEAFQATKVSTVKVLRKNTQLDSSRHK